MEEAENCQGVVRVLENLLPGVRKRKTPPEACLEGLSEVPSAR